MKTVFSAFLILALSASLFFAAIPKGNTQPPVGRAIDVFGGASNLGYGSGYPGPFPAPYGGQGPNNPMDLVFAESNVSLFAEVTYNGVAVQSVDVTFDIVGPSSSVTLNATTDATGIANVTYSMPWPVSNPESVMGLWQVNATGTVIGVQISDALQFFYDYPVRIWKVSTDKYYYNYSDVVGVWITYGTRAEQNYPALFVVGLENSSGVPFSLANRDTTFGGSIFGLHQNFTQLVGLVIPHLPGVGGYSYVHVNCYDKDLGLGGVQLCPEYVPPVRIVVIVLGDVDHDGRVNILDSILVSNAFLATPSSSNWNPDADINGDGVVNILDSIILSNHWTG
jgi:hypothetical protein